MASLPSVVLGFIAAKVLAPFIEDVVPAVLLSFATIPFAFVLGANLWQLLPRRVTLGLERYRLGFVALVVPFGLFLAVLLGPLMENLFFAGNLMGWLDGRVGGPTGGWTLVLLPVGVIVAVYATGLFRARFRKTRVRDMTERQAAGSSLVRLLVVSGVGVGLAWAFGATLGWGNVDPRGAIMGTYVQQNAMIVGFAMGFAVIPIIYTLAEDALSSVPQHLRAASLGSGATPWQTSIRIVVPTAVSGLFSACMIGLGRAVGETMIVVMAAGNTPIKDWNPFNGFQTLSAGIATEMPEAVRDSTHYRVLFLAGLALFAMTFVVNTAAELVRLRFRKKAVQL
jgi:phosphate transport system permease protein